MTATDGGNANELSGTILAIHVGKKKQIQMYLLNILYSEQSSTTLTEEN
jgi:hypothetical protein